MRGPEEGAAVSAHGPGSVPSDRGCVGSSEVLLGDGVCLIVGVTGVDKITRDERLAPGARDGPSRASGVVDSGAVPETENMVGVRFGTWQGKNVLRDIRVGGSWLQAGCGVQGRSHPGAGSSLLSDSRLASLGAWSKHGPPASALFGMPANIRFPRPISGERLQSGGLWATLQMIFCLAFPVLAYVAFFPNELVVKIRILYTHTHIHTHSSYTHAHTPNLQPSLLLTSQKFWHLWARPSA